MSDSVLLSIVAAITTICVAWISRRDIKRNTAPTGEVETGPTVQVV